MQMQDVIKLLDEVLGGLEQAAKQGGVGGTTNNAQDPSTAMKQIVSPAVSEGGEAPAGLGDAIDREIGAAGRQTNVVSLRDNPAVEQFRKELESESLTVTTVTSLLQLVRQALQILGVLSA